MATLQHSLAALASPKATVLNLYGSTEVAGDVTCAKFVPSAPGLKLLDPAAAAPIGEPIAGSQVLLLRATEQPRTFDEVLDGAAGEMVVLGSNLARGYWDSPHASPQTPVPAPSSTTVRPTRPSGA